MLIYLLTFIAGAILGWKGFERLQSVLLVSIPISLYYTYMMFITVYLPMLSGFASIPFFGSIFSSMMWPMVMAMTVTQFLILFVVYGLIALVGHYIGSRFSEED